MKELAPLGNLQRNSNNQAEIGAPPWYPSRCNAAAVAEATASHVRSTPTSATAVLGAAGLIGAVLMARRRAGRGDALL